MEQTAVPTQADIWLDLGAFAAQMKLSVRTFQRRVALGLVPGPHPLHVRPPRWLRAEVEEWIRMGCPRPEARRRHG